MPGLRFGPTGLLVVCLLAFSSVAAPTIRPSVIRSFPHDPTAFCQGLVYHNGYLYESTGQYGQSSLRKVELETGKVLKKEMLPSMLFGEGLAAYDHKLYQLTWKSRIGLVWFMESFRLLRNIQYNTEGWGLAFDGKQMILSDGTNLLHLHDPETFAEKKSLPVTNLGRPVKMLNELEYVDGMILANVWLTDSIAVIDPASGSVRGWIDCSGLLSKAEKRNADVLNGIAFDPEKKRLFLTGKNWPKLFEINYGKLKKDIAAIKRPR